MNINSMITSLSPTRRNEIVVDQARQLAAIMNMPGWQVIENIILMAKIKAEEKRRKELRLQSTREKCLYWDGVVDGAWEVRSEIFNVIEEAKQILEQNQNGGSDA